MRLAVLGATGRTGILVVREALARGHEVTAVVRNPDKLTDKHDNLQVVAADIFDSSSMVPHFKGRDAVLSCLGCGPSFLSMRKVTFFTDLIRPMVDAMREVKVTRLVFMSSWYTKYNSADPFIVNWVLKPLLLGQSLHNKAEMEDFLETDCLDIRYTLVRPPQLTDSEPTGKPVLCMEGQSIKSAERKRFTCCRKDVAKFMIDITEKDEHIRKSMAIASG
ncbi:flavin reductase (NADPH)-like [Mya arenaria]|uniref:flavin reductase (NADPH)-like n=1 Tax=Mya arenaria TaxID=6604 RepID=UPI0022E47983|nr:flavin reductase (NADPH)-like [Mya arenaria]XP_052785333.1 flavin reductase (NADPH)-like [Mya arenaria]